MTAITVARTANSLEVVSMSFPRISRRQAHRGKGLSAVGLVPEGHVDGHAGIGVSDSVVRGQRCTAFRSPFTRARPVNANALPVLSMGRQFRIQVLTRFQRCPSIRLPEPVQACPAGR